MGVSDRATGSWKNWTVVHSLMAQIWLVCSVQRASFRFPHYSILALACDRPPVHLIARYNNEKCVQMKSFSLIFNYKMILDVYKPFHQSRNEIRFPQLSSVQRLYNNVAVLLATLQNWLENTDLSHCCVLIAIHPFSRLTICWHRHSNFHYWRSCMANDVISVYRSFHRHTG